MEERTIEIGGFYRHFKNKLYQVKCIAYHSETKEKMVVYQALYGDYSVYVRPYEMFISEVDHIKYPDIFQKYRFEQVYLDGSQMPQAAAVKEHAEEQLGAKTSIQESADLQSDEEGEVDKRLLMFLDAETYQDKLNTLTSLRSNLDDKLINAMAASMDVEVLEGPIEKRYASLRSCILTQVKYECATRLR